MEADENSASIFLPIFAVDLPHQTQFSALVAQKQQKFRRTLVVGDIHGACLALDQVLERASFDPQNDRLISLGDLTDYNPENVRTLETLLAIPHFVSVKGNHDLFAEKYLDTGVFELQWRMNGGNATKDEFDRLDAPKKAQIRKLFRQQYRFFVDEDHRLYVHAGFDPKLPIVAQSENVLYWDRKFWEAAARWGLLNDPFPENEFKEVFIGHTQTAKNWPDCLPKNFGNVWNLDQGAKQAGRLTLMDVETKEFWQSDPTVELYP